MLLTFSLCLLLGGAAGLGGGLQPMSGIQPLSLKAQPAPGGRSRFFQSGFFWFGSGSWRSRRPQLTPGVSPPLPLPPAHLPLANLPPRQLPPETLLAFRNGSILAVRSYRIEGRSIHYTTNYGAQNQAALDALDLEPSRRLNEDRQVPFDVP